jgi:hypothetical protein
MRTVQLSTTDAGYAAVLREALTGTESWQAERVDRPDLVLPCVRVRDDSA